MSKRKAQGATRLKNPGRRARAEVRRNINHEKHVKLAGPVGVVERMELDAMTPDVWLPRVLSDPTISAGTKAYARELAAKSDKQGGRIPDELFQA